MTRPTYLLTAEVGHPFIPMVQRLARQPGIGSICDFGGGANPVLPLEDIQGLGLRYLVVDASAQELAKASPGYSKRVLDLTAPSVDLGERFDLVVSKFVAEHVEDPGAFHAAAWRALRPGGYAAHFYPTLPAPVFLANRLLKGPATRRVIDVLQPGLRDPLGPAGKFCAYYRWCEGPTRRQYRRFAGAGFEVADYVVLVGHRYYERLPSLQRAADALSRRALRLRRPVVSTYAWVVLRRLPADDR